jgi:hypothetical protein
MRMELQAQRPNWVPGSINLSQLVLLSLLQKLHRNCLCKSLLFCEIDKKWESLRLNHTFQKYFFHDACESFSLLLSLSVRDAITKCC